MSINKMLPEVQGYKIGDTIYSIKDNKRLKIVDFGWSTNLFHDKTAPPNGVWVEDGYYWKFLKFTDIKKS